MIHALSASKLSWNGLAKTFLLAALLLGFGGCGDKLALSQNPAVARTQLEKLLPAGTSRVDAEKLLTQLGVKHVLQHGRFGSDTFSDYIYCDYSDGGFPVVRRWQAALVLKGDKVVDYRVTFGLIGP